MAESDKKIGVELKKLNNLIKRRLIKSKPVDDGAKLGAGGFIIGYVAESRVSVYQKDIEKEFKIRRPTATAMLKRLEAAGFLVRVGEDGDKRLKRIVLTDKAKKMHEEFTKRADEIESEFDSVISPSERSQLLKIIEKLQSRLEQND